MLNKNGNSVIFLKNFRYSKRKLFSFGILFFFLSTSLIFFNNGISGANVSLTKSNLQPTDGNMLTDVSVIDFNQFKSDIELKSFSSSSNHYITEPITLFIDDNVLMSKSAGSIQRVDFFDNTNPSNPTYLGSSKWNSKSSRWELTVTFDKPGIKAITAEIITTEGYTTQTSSLVQINDEITGTAGDYYSAVFGSDTIWEIGNEGASGHFEDHAYEIWFGIDAEIQLDVQLHEITKAYYDSSTAKWHPTKESVVRLTAEAYRIHGIIHHESFGNIFKFQVSDIEADDYVSLGRAEYRWFGDSNDDYVYMHNKETTFSGSYCIGMKIDIDLDLSAWTDDGKSWSTGGYDYRLLYFGFKAQASDLTVVASAIADEYYLQVYDREPPTMNGPVVDDIRYYYGGLHVTNPEYLKNSVKFRADFTPMVGVPSTGTHEYRWRLDLGTWSAWIATTNTYAVSPYFNKGSSGTSMVTVEVRDTYYYNTRDYAEQFNWDYTDSISSVDYDNLVKSSSSSLDDITSGTLQLSQNYANPTDSGCGVDRTEDIWKYMNINNNWQTIGVGDGIINWNVDNLPDADPGYQLSYYTEDRLGNGDTNTAIWVKTNNKVPVLNTASTRLSKSYTVGNTIYVDDTTDWTVYTYDNVGTYERDDGIQSMYVRIWTDIAYPLVYEIHYEDTVTGFTYAYTSGGHKVYTLTLTDLFDLPTLTGIHNKQIYLDFKIYDGLGAESTFMRYSVEIRMDYSAEHHGASLELSNVSPTYSYLSITYISGITRLAVTGNDPDISDYEWFVGSTSLATTNSNYYDLNSETLVDGNSYNFKVKVTDIFGNTFTSAVTQQYTVDNTIPEVNITSIFDYNLLKGTVSLEWTTEFTDIQDAFWQYRFWNGINWIDWQNITDSDSDFYNPLLWDTYVLPEYSTYEIQIKIVDKVSLTATDVVGQITIDNVSPTILEIPDNLAYEFGSINNILSFNVTDLNPSFYSVYRENVFLYDNNWTNINFIEIDVDGLDVGIYYYYLVFHDSFENNITTSEISVTVEDTTPPIVTEPADFSYVVGSTGNTIEWTATDLKPSSYSIYLNDSYLYGGAWFSGKVIVVNVNGLSVGTYSYRIIFYDLHSNSLSNIVNVTVIVDDSNPFLAEQEDIIYELGDVGNEIVWNANDVNPDTYILYINDVLDVSDTWTNENAISVDVDGLGPGEYLYRIEFYDQYDNMVYDEVLVVVEDTTIPEIIGPIDKNYEEGSSGNTISWSVLDLKPNEYILYINSTLNKTGTWSNSEALVFNIDGLSPGTYNYTLVVFDTSGNYASDEAFITVTAKTKRTSAYSIILALMTISVTVYTIRKKRRY